MFCFFPALPIQSGFAFRSGPTGPYRPLRLWALELVSLLLQDRGPETTLARQLYQIQVNIYTEELAVGHEQEEVQAKLRACMRLRVRVGDPRVSFGRAVVP